MTHQEAPGAPGAPARSPRALDTEMTIRDALRACEAASETIQRAIETVRTSYPLEPETIELLEEADYKTWQAARIVGKGIRN